MRAGQHKPSNQWLQQPLPNTRPPHHTNTTAGHIGNTNTTSYSNNIITMTMTNLPPVSPCMVCWR